jgi:hypothetical protein
MMSDVNALEGDEDGEEDTTLVAKKDASWFEDVEDYYGEEDEAKIGIEKQPATEDEDEESVRVMV